MSLKVVQSAVDNVDRFLGGMSQKTNRTGSFEILQLIFLSFNHNFFPFF